LLANPLLDSQQIIEPSARYRLTETAAKGRVIVLRLDQTDVGDRALPLI